MRWRDLIMTIGGAALWPLAVRAQQASMPVIGFLNGASAEGFPHRLGAFRQGLKEAGYVEGRNVVIKFRWADGHYDRLSSLAAELVSRNVAVLVATGGSAAGQAAKHATSTIPIVFTSGGDPLVLELVSSLSHPGGNVTGAALLTTELVAKRFEVLRELVPGARIGGMLINPSGRTGGRDEKTVGDGAAPKGVTIHGVRVQVEADFDVAFSALAKGGAQAPLVGADAFFEDRRSQLAAMATRYSLPAVYDSREYVSVGGLLSYG